MKIKNDVQGVIFIRINGKLEFLVLNRFDKDKGKNHFRLVKGGVEEGEKPEESLKREIKEELGIENIFSEKRLSNYSYIVGEVKHEVEVFLVEVSPEVKVKVDSEEEGGFTIHEAIWMTKEEAEEKLTFKEEKDLVENVIKNYKLNPYDDSKILK